MRIISIANQKGGCGKTTTSINLASALSSNGKKVLLFDLDPQAHASLGLDVQSQDSIYNVISNLTPRKLKIDNIITRIEDRFDLVPSNILVGTLEQELADEIGRELKLIDVINQVKDRYDYILIDCAPSLGILTVNSIRASQELIIPVETSRFSMQGVDHLMDIVFLVKDRLGHHVDCRILVTMFDSRLRHSFAMLSSIKEKFGEILYDTIVHNNVKLKESAVMGKTVASYDKYCRGTKDYFSLAKEIIMIHDSSSKQEESKEVKPQEVRVAQKPAKLQEVARQQKIKEEIKEAIEQPEEALEEVQAVSSKMEEIVKQELEGFFTTKFCIDAAGAKSVYVTGSFNDWSLDDNCRMKEVGGQWEVDIPLKSGLYKYQFIVDGVWKEDPANKSKERNSFGDINSLIEVGAKE